MADTGNVGVSCTASEAISIVGVGSLATSLVGPDAAGGSDAGSVGILATDTLSVTAVVTPTVTAVDLVSAGAVTSWMALITVTDLWFQTDTSLPLPPVAGGVGGSALTPSLIEGNRPANQGVSGGSERPPE